MINLVFIIALVIAFPSASYSQSFMDKIKNFNAPAIKDMIETKVLEKTSAAQQEPSPSAKEVGVTTKSKSSSDSVSGEDGAVEGLDSAKKRASGDGYVRPSDFYDFPSLFFTVKQRENIDDARHFTGDLYHAYIQSIEDKRQKEALHRALEIEQNRGRSFEVEEREKPAFDKRFIALEGIMFSSPESWTVWINGVRMEPGKIPSYIADLKVTPETVEFKWYDEYSNKVIPLRLRSLERFHIDSRTFFKGG